MKRLLTQFDSDQSGVAVATPTCSSCCCCCCCLATVATTSGLMAQKVRKETKVKNIKSSWSITTLAALFIPATALLTAASFNLINSGFARCETKVYNGSRLSNYSYQVCTNEVNSLLPFIWIASFVGMLWYIYKRIHMEAPLKRSIVVAIMFHLAFAVEFAIGLFAVLSTAGIAYLFVVPVIVGWINVWYKSHLKNKG